jgi:hypothetical protein
VPGFDGGAVISNRYTMNNHVIPLRPTADRSAKPKAVCMGLMQPERAATDIGVGDWDLLFRAAIERLAALAAVQQDEPADPRLDLSGSTRGVMLACVDAFTQLHATAARAFGAAPARDA